MQAGYQEAKHEYQRHFASREYQSSGFPEDGKVMADDSWCSARGIDYLADFKDYLRETEESLAMDMIADVSVGRNESGSFSKWLKDRHGTDGLKEVRFKPQASKTIEDMWPSWMEVTNRVFANDIKTYRDVCKRAAAEPN
ncbi:hypothetical protein KI688_009746 [Linnemannia hyalina]|uniref:Uncharacterized protein n=1 Tax=Linnemannia hyalina TaxID=64524 RepID=A0A9P7Y2Q5_9FUNG|nr:hypothetical protein KI688_009746 [Linnemannia hyalina]